MTPITLRYDIEQPEITQQQWVRLSFDQGATWQLIGYFNRLLDDSGGLFNALPAFTQLAESDKADVVQQMEEDKACHVRVSQPPLLKGQQLQTAQKTAAKLKAQLDATK